MPPAFVQFKAGSGANGHSATIAYASDNGAGNLLVFVARNNVTAGTIGTPATVTDSQGNTWTVVTSFTPQLNNWFTMAYAPNAKAGPNTVTFTLQNTLVGGFTLSLLEYSGVATVSPLDQNNVSGVSSGFGTSILCGSVTPTKAGELIVGGVIQMTSGGPLTYTQGAGFTIRDNGSTNNQTGTEDQIQTAPTTVNPAFTLSVSGQSWFAGVMTFFAGGSPQRTLRGAGL